MPNGFQLLELQRTDPGKKPIFLHIEESGENHADYPQREVAKQAELGLDYLEV